MNILFYLLESNLYLVMLYGFYRALLHRETFHKLNRWYLLMAIVLAFTAPLLKVDYQPASVPEQMGERNARVVVGGSELVKSENNKTHKQFNVLPRFSLAIKAGTNVTMAPAFFLNPARTLSVVYLLVTLFCLLSTFAGLLRIIRLYRRSLKFSSDGVTHVLLEQEGEAFSFFNWLFYHPAIQPDSAIITHELVHIRQKHSLDLLFFDLVRSISWFNPVLYMMRRDLKLNHEYLADDQASRECINRHAYALLLIDHSCSKFEWAMTHQMFSARQLKARILRLSKQQSASKAKSKYMLVLPVLAVIVGLSAFTISKDYGLVNLTIKDQNTPSSLVCLTAVSAFKIQAFSNICLGAVKDDQKAIKDEPKPANLSAVAQLCVAEEQNIVPASAIKTQDTVPPRAVTASAADSLRNKSWAPQYIRDSVQKYEWAAKLISDSMQNDGRKANEILYSIQKERSDHHRKIQDSIQKALASMPVKDRLYHTAAEDLPDQATKDRLAYVDLIINRIKTNYVEMQRLIQASNAFRSQVRDSFPMHVSKFTTNLTYYISFEGTKIPAPDNRFWSAWVKNETERLAFFANSD